MNKNKTDTEVLPVVREAMSIDISTINADIVACRVDQEESILHKQRVAVSDKIKSVDKSISDIDDAINKRGAALAEEKVEPLREVMTNALNTWKYEDIEITVGNLVLALDEQLITFSIVVACTDVGGIKKTTKNKRKRPTNHCSFTARRAYKAPKPLLDLAKQRNDLYAYKSELEKVQTRVIGAMGDIPRMERAARAALAREMLKHADNGASILESLDKSVSPFADVHGACNDIINRKQIGTGK